ncbi:MAG: NADH-quinone oxidoreductase subunit J [Bacteroidia bacterium]|nr:NADH-quinone oxidoreductase subunit J [Bacteroidia bacterium]
MNADLLTEYAFYGLSFLAIACALMVVLSRNPVHSVLYLIMTFFCIGGHYLLLNAQFLFAVHIMVYAGAIMVLFLYVIMMLNLNKESEPRREFMTKLLFALPAGLLVLVLSGAVGANAEMTIQGGQQIGLVENLGDVLFKQFLLPFEISSVLFLAGMVGAVLLGKREVK